MLTHYLRENAFPSLSVNNWPINLTYCFVLQRGSLGVPVPEQGEVLPRSDGGLRALRCALHSVTHMDLFLSRRLKYCQSLSSIKL